MLMQRKRPQSKLYHFQIGIPASIPLRFGVMELRYSNHALHAANTDRYGHIELPATLDTNKAQVIEVEVGHDGLVEKILYRIPYSKDCDLVLAVIPFDRFVKTVWLNQKSDLHFSLDRSRYTQVRRG